MTKPLVNPQAPSRAPLFPGASKCGGCGTTLTPNDKLRHRCGLTGEKRSGLDPVEVLPGAALSDWREP